MEWSSPFQYMVEMWWYGLTLSMVLHYAFKVVRAAGLVEYFAGPR